MANSLVISAPEQQITSENGRGPSPDAGNSAVEPGDQVRRSQVVEAAAVALDGGAAHCFEAFAEQFDGVVERPYLTPIYLAQRLRR